MDIKKDFPIFVNNPDLVFLDNGASTQKCAMVLDGMVDLFSNSYANIHRGVYDLSQKSEHLYNASKEKIKDFINADSKNEIIYTYNSTYAANLIAGMLKKSGKLKKGDKVLTSITEHHANIVPWLILKDELGIEVEFVEINKDFIIDIGDFKRKYDENVKVVSLTYVSNVLGTINPLKEISEIIRDDTYFIVDGSQSVPHLKTDVKELNCDFMFFTGHKMMADTGIGVLYGKKKLLDELDSPISGGGAISWVHKDSFKQALAPTKFEPGTPNISGAVSMLKAIEYMEKIGGYDKIEKWEEELTSYALNKFNAIDKLKLAGPTEVENRIGVFSFSIEGIHPNDISDMMADHNICIRTGKHCTEPLMQELGLDATARMSLYIYNTKEDIDKFFEILQKAIKFFS